MLAANFFWLADTVVIFSSLPYALSLGVVALFATVFSIPYLAVYGLVPWIRQRVGLLWVLVFPAMQVANEAFFPALFPYFLGAFQYETPWIWQLASVTGAASVTWLLFFTNATLAECLYRKRAKQPMPFALLGGNVALILAVLAFGASRHQQVEDELSSAPVLKAAILQQSITMEERFQESPWKSLSDWSRLTRAVVNERPDLVVWPEGSVVFNPNSNRVFRALGQRSPKQFFEQMVAEGDFDFLVGGGTITTHGEPNARGQQDFTAYNSAYMFSRENGLNGRYDKMVPLPFGEYIPFSDTFPFLKNIIQGPGDFQAGTEVTVFEGSYRDGDSLKPYTFTVPICYEAILERQMRLMTDADLFVNITNDAWFGDTAAPYQHGLLSAVQAIQYGRPMLRIAYTGLSFVVEPHGEIRYETEPFTESYMVGEIRMLRLNTIYESYGWLFQWFCLIGAGAVLVWGFKQERVTHSRPSA